MPRRRSSARVVRGQCHDRGYILLTLVFFVAVLALSLAAILPSIKQEIQRDRELELVHRGAQYTRAIRLYYKKTGRYPAKIEDLESTNNLRFLRKRYKDPMARVEGAGGNGPDQADFKILHFGDPSVHMQENQPGIAAAALAAQSQGGAGAAAAAGRRSRNSPSLALSPDAANPDPNKTDPPAADGSTGASANPPADGSTSTAPPKDAPVDAGDGDTGAGTSSKSASGDQSFGGGAMVGVASTSALNSIREFNKKHHYNEWQFLYDPTTDRGGLPNGPWQPQTFTGQPAGVGNQIGQPVNPTAPGGNASADHNPQQ